MNEFQRKRAIESGTKKAIEFHKLLASSVEQPDKWLATPNPRFGGRRPIDLLGTDEEAKVLDLLRAVDRWLF